MIGSTGTWRSRSITLALLGMAGGAFGLGSCSSGTWQRNVYRTSFDCDSDYPGMICSEKGERTTEGTYLGPPYRMAAGKPSACRSDDPGPGSSALAAWGSPRRIDVRIVRGGFGTTCRSSSRSSSSSSSSWHRISS